MRSFRIVVVGHGDLAAAFASAAQMICGQIPSFDAVGLRPDDSPESFQERLVAAAPDPDEPLLILTDLVGGTPHNVALVVARRRPAAVVISGVNLAVLMEAAMSGDGLDSELVARLVSTGREAMTDAASLMASRTT